MSDREDDTQKGEGPLPTAAELIEAGLDADTVIERFGGIRPLASRLDIAVSTVQGWKARNHIPDNRWDDIIAAARADGVSLAPPDPSERVEAEPAEPVSAWGPVGTQSKEEDNDMARQDVEDGEKQADSAAPEGTEPAHQPDQLDPEEAKAPPPPPPAPPAKGASGVAWVALVLVIVALFGVLTQSYWQPAYGPAIARHLENFFGPAPAAQTRDALAISALSEEVAAASAAIETINTRIAALEAAGEDGQSEELAAALAPLRDRLSALEDRAGDASAGGSGPAVDLAPLEEAVSALRSRLEAGLNRSETSLQAFRAELETFADQMDATRSGIEGVGEQLSALEARLDEIEAGAGGPGAREAALVLAVSQVEARLAEGGGLDDSLEDLAALAPGTEAMNAHLQTLRGLGGLPVPTLSDLTLGFADIAARVDRAEKIGAAEGWLDETLAELSGLVSLRRVGADPEAPIASQAEAALQRGDLQQAADLVRPLADADPAIADWLARADRRLTADSALEALREAAVDRLRAVVADG